MQGCRECKTRKIKVSLLGFPLPRSTDQEQCDEARPICGNCRKRYIDTSCCQYVSKKEHRRGSSEDSRSPPKLSASLSVIPTGLGHSNILELRLMHNYTQSTCGRGTMLASVPLLSIWEVDIPQIAFSSEIVLNGMKWGRLFTLFLLKHLTSLLMQRSWNPPVTLEDQELTLHLL